MIHLVAELRGAQWTNLYTSGIYGREIDLLSVPHYVDYARYNNESILCLRTRFGRSLAQRTPPHTTCRFHPPRRNIVTATTANTDAAIATAQNTPLGPNPSGNASAHASGICSAQFVPRLITVGVHVSPAPLNAQLRHRILLNTAPCGMALPSQPSGQSRVKSIDRGSSVSFPVRRSILAKRARVMSVP